MRNLASPDTDLAGFVRGLAGAAAEVAPVAQQQGQLFVDLETTFGAFAAVARPFIQETISKSPETEDTAIRTLPVIRPLLKNTAGLFSDLRPGFAALRPVSYDVMRSVTVGVKALRLAPGFNAQLDPTAQALLDFNNNANVREGLDDLDAFFGQAQPLLAHVGPAQSVCNYATLLFRNVANHLAFGDGIGTWQRFIPIDAGDGTEQRGQPGLRTCERRRPGGPTSCTRIRIRTPPRRASPRVSASRATRPTPPARS